MGGIKRFTAFVLRLIFLPLRIPSLKYFGTLPFLVQFSKGVQSQGKDYDTYNPKQKCEGCDSNA